MVMNDNKLIAIVRPGDKSGTGFHGGGESWAYTMFQFDKSSSTETVKTKRQSLQNDLGSSGTNTTSESAKSDVTANSPCNIQQVIFIIGPQATINPKNLKKCSAGTITPPFPIAANNMEDFHVPMMKI
ncbi:hypothetical protein CUMW_112510 [Citrus unshiu]|nr:hypothetical protein CUMW_112510 [Citrus unshiu]